MFSNKFKKNVTGLFVLLLTCFLLIGCSNEKQGSEKKEAVSTEDKNIIAIRAVTEKEFTGPDKKYIKLSEELLNKQIEESYELARKEREAIQKYAEETYKVYFTENGFTNFLNSSPAFLYHRMDGNYEMNMENLEINQEKDHPTIYRFTFRVNLKEANGDISSYDFKGEAICPEEGNIGKIMFGEVELGALSSKLNEIANEE